MTIENHLAWISKVYRNTSKNLVLCLIVNKNKQGLSYVPSKLALELLKDQMGVASDSDLVGRECEIAYEHEPNFRGWFYAKNIKGIEPAEYETSVESQ